ncbi:alpha/beta fold hydrolase [Streptomyces sp. 549]|nr:alpha/beta hydrolase [Streptomyces sp. 549]MDK1473350.1 alpha/beta fold hydrolase [Streptomyces sp. 549]
MPGRTRSATLGAGVRRTGNLSTIAERHVVLRGNAPQELVIPYAEAGYPGSLPIVLVHGWADSWRTFEPVLRRFPASLHGYAPTQRGHGDAAKPPDGYTPEELAADLVSFMDAVGIERAVLVGGSSGGVQARIVAGRYPDRVAGLVLLGTPAALADKPGAMELWEAVRELPEPVDRAFAEEFSRGMTAGSMSPAFTDAVVTESLKAPARVWRDTLRGLLETDLPATLSGILVPTLVLWGDRDELLTREDQQTVLDAIPGSRLVVYEGAGHCLYWERPEHVVRDLADFVATLDPGTPGAGPGPAEPGPDPEPDPAPEPTGGGPAPEPAGGPEPDRAPGPAAGGPEPHRQDDGQQEDEQSEADTAAATPSRPAPDSPGGSGRRPAWRRWLRV